jgi:hypothetical protein
MKVESRMAEDLRRSWEAVRSTNKIHSVLSQERGWIPKQDLVMAMTVHISQCILQSGEGYGDLGKTE